MADSVATLGMDLGINQAVGSEREGEKETVRCEILIYQRIKSSRRIT